MYRSVGIPSWHRHPWWLRLGVLLLSAVLSVAVGKLWPQGVSTAEGVVADGFWRWAASTSPERRVVIVDIDETSLSQVGPWPWSRETIASLSRRLTQAGATVQGFDIAFSDERSGDDQLVEAWRKAPVVAAQILSIDPKAAPQVGRLSGGAAGRCPPGVPVAHGHYGLSPSLLEARPATGHITPHVEADGVVRRLPALICADGRIHPSLALAMLWLAAQPDDRSLQAVPDWRWNQPADGVSWLGPAAWLTSPSLPGINVPVGADGSMVVPYRITRQAFVSVPAVDVLRGQVDPSVLRGALVLVGASAFGTGDTVSTPLAAVSSGVEVHAQSLVGLLDGQTPYLPVGWPALGLLAGFVLAGFLLWTAVGVKGGAPAKRLPITGATLAFALTLVSGLALTKLSVVMPWLVLVLFVLLASVSLATVEHALARAQGRRLSAHLGAYLPAPVAQRLMVTDPSGQLQVDQLDISVMVADIRNFSAHAAHRSPEETASLLHAFVTIAVDVVERHGGVVENVVGDSVLAVWNAPPGKENHAARALAAARELYASTQVLLASRSPTSETSRVQPLALGIGLESGSAIVASLGPTRRRAHAALGEPVSVANRLQQMTSDLSVPILIGPHLAGMLAGESLEAQGDYLLEGMGKHYQVFAPADWAELVDIDANWASSAASVGGNPGSEPEEWARWGKPARSSASTGSRAESVVPIAARQA